MMAARGNPSNTIERRPCGKDDAEGSTDRQQEQPNHVPAKEAVSHADLRTTMQYTYLAREHLRSLVEQEPKREELRDLA